jgi:hypothetical protein
MPFPFRSGGRLALRAAPAAVALALAAAPTAAHAADPAFDVATFAAGDAPTAAQAVAAGDLTGDGRPDVLSVSWWGEVFVLRGTGDGRLAEIQRLRHGWRHGHAAIADVDGDGDREGVVGDVSRKAVYTLFNDGSGRLTVGREAGYPPTMNDLDMADVDADGRADALVSEHESGEVSIGNSIFDGWLAAGQGLPSTLPGGASFGQLDGDGKPDVVVAEGGDARRLTVWRGNGQGLMDRTPLTHVALPAAATRVEVADMTGDGASDLVAATGDRLWLGRGNGRGGFATAVEIGGVAGDGAQEIVLADVDRNGRDDVALVDGAQVQVLLNAGGGSFVSSRHDAGVTRPRRLAAADFDGDGAQDLVVGGDGFVSVLRNRTDAGTPLPPDEAPDTTAPAIDVASPAAGAVVELGAELRAAFGCTDADSGVASCTGSVADGALLPTDAVGEHALTVDASDHAGNAATATRTYRVIWPFTGFLAPVNAAPTLNAVAAGRAVPLRFSLGADRGLEVVAAVRSQQVACADGAPVDALEESAPAGASGLTYEAGAGRYLLPWKTSEAWTGTCRQLALELADGSTHRATFKFR